jgi:hypothetical protein
MKLSQRFVTFNSAVGGAAVSGLIGNQVGKDQG